MPRKKRTKYYAKCATLLPVCSIWSRNKCLAINELCSWVHLREIDLESRWIHALEFIGNLTDGLYSMNKAYFHG